MSTLKDKTDSAPYPDDKVDNAEVSHKEELDRSSTSSTFDDSVEQTAVSRAVWLITFTVATGGFLFGEDPQSDEIRIEPYSFGAQATALIGALIAGLPADKYGRKLWIYIDCFLFLVGSIIQASSFSVPQMAVGRFVVGLGVGSAAMIVPLYIGEIASARYRGTMIAFDNTSVTLGQLISYALGAGLTEVSHGWRYMVAIGGIPPIILAALLPKCPESPRQLISHGKVEEASRVIARTFREASEAQATAKVNHISWTLEQQNAVGGDKALTATCAVMAVSQLGGFNTLMYYSATLFSLVGFSKPTAVSIVVGATNFVFNFLNMVVIDKFGRRQILLVIVLGMAISLVIAAAAFHYIPISKDLIVESTTVNWAGILVLVTIIFYVAFFASGCATIAWVGTELLPTEVRALGTMMNTVTCWGCNLIIVSTFLSLMKAATPSRAFGFYAGICFFGWLFLIFFYPECKGLPLEDIREVFANDFGVKRAAQLQKEHKIQRQEGAA